MKYFTLCLSFITMLLFGGCFWIKDGPFHLIDGNGMVYVDKDYRTEYANAFPFDEEGENHSSHYFVGVFSGKGQEGKENTEKYIKTLFEGKIPRESIEKIYHQDFGGENYFLIIPRYNQKCTLSSADGKISVEMYDGIPFTLCCDEAKIYMWAYGGIEAIIKADGNGSITDDRIWDVSEYVK